jgi:peptide/nickel transport system ATP-binding protein
MPLLKINGLSVKFDHHTAVDNISFSVERGEVLGIVGESGSGKSMTALSLMGLCPPQADVIAKAGMILSLEENKTKDLSLSKLSELRKIRGNLISMIFQEPMTSLNPVQRCGHQVAEILRIHNKGKKSQIRKRVLELFGEVLLPEPEKVYRKYPHQLSGGQRQRVMIAMAIACKPLLLLADEPTTALDVTVQRTILKLLKDLQKKYGMSVIFITHDLGVVREICDRVVVMKQGIIVEEFSVEKLIHNTVEHPYTKGLLACRPPENSRPHRLLTVADFHENPEGTVFQERIHTEREKNEKILLQVKSLSKHFPVGRSLTGKPQAWFKAVDDVGFQVFAGETLGLVGESGCGKTTLSRVILGLTESTSGDILFDGVPVVYGKSLRNFRKQAQIIFQDPYSSLNPNMTIGRALTEPLKVHRMFSNRKEREDYVAELLEKTGLSGDDMRKYPHQFSGGQRQRIVIARALVLKPRFIICDEAVSALDVSVQAQVLNLLNDLKDEFGLTYLFISHDLSVVKYMSQRLFVMKSGKIIESGSADTVFNHPEHEYTRKLIESVPGRKVLKS